MKSLYCFAWLCLLATPLCFGQSSPAFEIKELPEKGILLNKGWKWQAGDNPDWAKPEFDDSKWKDIDPTGDIMDLPQFWNTDIGWLRLRFTTDNRMSKQSLALLVQQTGASEIFLNGKLIGHFGKITGKAQQVRAATPVKGTFIGLPIREVGEQVLAVRFAVQKGIPYVLFANQKNVAFSLQLIETDAISAYLRNDIRIYFDFIKLGLFLLLAIIHFALFYFNTSQKANFYFFLFAVSSILYSILGPLTYYYTHYAATKMAFFAAFTIDGLVVSILMQAAIYEMFNQHKEKIFWGLVLYAVISSVVLFVDYHNGFAYTSVLPLLVLLETIRITIAAVRRRQRGAFIVVWGIFISLLFYPIYFAILFEYLPEGQARIYEHLAFNIMYVSIPVAISVYLALESTFTSRTLTEKLWEIQQLSAEKQQILAAQNATLENQVNERTAELKQSFAELKAAQGQLIQKEKMASLGELTAGIAHEIQNPLNFVNNLAEVSTELVTELKEEQDKPSPDAELQKELLTDLEESLQKINLHGKRADSIVKGMLQHSQTSSGQKELTDLNALAEEYLRLSYHGFRDKDKSFEAELRLHLDPNLVRVAQDLGRVLLNLYNNAFYAVQEKQKQQSNGYKPEIHITTQGQNGKVELRVKDNGTGIPQELVDKIYQPFFTTKPTGQGTGLGLSLSYDIVTKGHQGEMKAETREGEYTELIVILPAKT